MRLLELTLLLACAAFGIRLAALGRAAGIPWIHGMQLLLAVVLIAQLMVEGWRWQVLPAYAATLLVAATPSLSGVGAPALFWSAAAGFGLLAVSVMSCLVFPFAEPQAPRGPFAVGLTTIPVTVQRPPDVGPYELKAVPQVQLWYPAQAQGRQAGLTSLLARRAAARFRAEPAAPASADALVAQAGQKFPVVIYFDGWPEDRTQNITLLLELASRGFAVASVTYQGIGRPMVDYSSAAGFEHSVQLDHSRARLHARDAIAVLDTLSRLAGEPGNGFAQRLDTQHAGMLGFSFGGAIAAEASRLDSRIQAAVNLDGRHWGEALERGVEKPYMFICEELSMPSAADLASTDPMTRYEARLDRLDYSQLAANLQAQGGVRVTIAGTAHMNFTDRALRSPLRRFTGAGPIDARRAQEIIRTFVVEFFSRYAVPGQPPPLDSPWPHFPEVRLQSWPAPGAQL
jgi:dienelactone hydrolase